MPGQVISISLKMDARAAFSLTKTNMEHIEAVGGALNQELREKHGLDDAPIRSVFAIIEDAQSAMLYAELLPVADRPSLPIMDVVRSWRERIGTVEGAVSFQLSGSEELAGGFELQLQSRDTDLLALASVELREFLADIDGVHNVRDSLTPGQPELEIRIKQQARSLGFDSAQLATQIGYAYGGASVQTVQRGDKEVKVLVLNNKLARNSLDDLLQSRLRTRDGRWIPISAVADIKGRYASSHIRRVNGMRTNRVLASIDKSVVAPQEVAQAVHEKFWPDMEKRFPSVTLKQGGELSEMVEMKGGLQQALLIACVLIYILMAVPLKSYWQPIIILSIVPFGFICAAFGHLIMDLPLSLLSFFGMLALTGVIVNDCLVMITRFNEARAGGADLQTGLREAGVGRFQAIFLTTATTVMGLMPLMMETSEQAQYLIPAAVSLAFGELFGTFLTLILVPVLLAITEDIKLLFGKKGRQEPLNTITEHV